MNTSEERSINQCSNPPLLLLLLFFADLLVDLQSEHNLPVILNIIYLIRINGSVSLWCISYNVILSVSSVFNEGNLIYLRMVDLIYRYRNRLISHDLPCMATCKIITLPDFSFIA